MESKQFYNYVVFENKEYSRTELAKLIGRSQSNTDINIKRAANGENVEIFNLYNIKVIDIKKSSK